MLLSAGHSIRPRPLAIWLRSLGEIEADDQETVLSTLNQLALIAVFNGRPALAELLCREAIDVVKERFKPEAHIYALQPWVNEGRLQANNWPQSRSRFRLPQYALGLQQTPDSCPILDLSTFSNRPSLMRFFWAVFVAEYAKAVLRKICPISEFIRELDLLSGYIPPEFNYSISEIRFRYDLLEQPNAITTLSIYKLSPSTVRQCVSQLALEASLASQQGDYPNAVDAAVSAICHIQRIDDDENADVYLAIALFALKILSTHIESSLFLALRRWLVVEALSLRNEPIMRQAAEVNEAAYPFAQTDDSIGLPATSASHYFRFNSHCTALDTSILSIRTRLLETQQ